MDEQATTGVSTTGRLAKLAPGADLEVRVDAESHICALGSILDWHLDSIGHFIGDN